MKSKTWLLAATAALFAAPSAAQDDGNCDRQCLLDMADTYLSAMVAHDPSKAPLASDVVMVENLKRIAPGEGLWASLTGAPGDYKIPVADPISQEVGVMTVAPGADGKPVMFSVRLKRDGGRIVEAEHIIGNALSPGQLANLQAPRPALLRPVPYEYADSRGRMIWLGKSYYNALDNNNSKHSAMADDCERRENGFQTARNPMSRPLVTGNGQADPAFAYLGGLGCAAQMDTNMWEYISAIHHRRVEIADPVTGLVWGQSHFQHDFTKKDFELIGVPGTPVRHMEFNPFDMPAVHIYKVWGGQIHEIEAVGWTAPYKSPNWTDLTGQE
ncbi:hypothetical protein GRI89_05395 [Altererythrobacter salegens]|uniref:DUF8021 domain-containing protein n=1 Tax=Croceibacterium salegens TaxID=1737568 RepID=A0A6I4SSK8_9SPHN|nr:hypothetical protein [Croceibacterium salegens]MXO58971.1 hypothetical protein [Croceibacterium salegens]